MISESPCTRDVWGLESLMVFGGGEVWLVVEAEEEGVYARTSINMHNSCIAESK